MSSNTDTEVQLSCNDYAKRAVAIGQAVESVLFLRQRIVDFNRDRESQKEFLIHLRKQESQKINSHLFRAVCTPAVMLEGGKVWCWAEGSTLKCLKETEAEKIRLDKLIVNFEDQLKKKVKELTESYPDLSYHVGQSEMISLYSPLMTCAHDDSSDLD